MPLVQGPIQPGTSAKVFRKTGKTKRLFKGPIQPGTDPETFRETGRGVPIGRGGNGGVAPPKIPPAPII